MNFENFLQEKLGKHDCKTIEELILDELFVAENGTLTKEHKSTLEKYVNLQCLTCLNIKLKSLKNMPHLPNLTVLELENNELTGNDFNEIIDLYPNLWKLNIRNNKISTYDCLKPLAKMSKLENINIKGNPLTEKRDYSRDKVFEIIPSLQVIDSMNKDGEEVENSSIEGEDDGEIDDFIDEEGEEFDDEENVEEDDENEEEQDEEDDE